jgi:hypothetical protein
MGVNEVSPEVAPGTAGHRRPATPEPPTGPPLGGKGPDRGSESPSSGGTDGSEPAVLPAIEYDGFGNRKGLRPWWCQDPSCTPDCSDTGAQQGSFAEHPEMSGFCSGRVPAPITFERHGLTHHNDGHLCFRSAVRGVVMLEVNEGDLDAVMRVAVRSILGRKPDRQFNGRWYTGRDEGWTT